jgi:hypothetical protein
MMILVPVVLRCRSGTSRQGGVTPAPGEHKPAVGGVRLCATTLQADVGILSRQS